MTKATDVLPAQAGTQRNVLPAQAGIQRNVIPAQGGIQRNVIPAQAGTQRNVIPAKAGIQGFLAGGARGARTLNALGSRLRGNDAWPRQVHGALLALVSALALAGCATPQLAPKYEAPPIQAPIAFKQGEGAWVPADRADNLERGPWWQLFDDPVLTRLAERVAVDNQSVAAAAASYAQARAITREQRSQLFPRVGLNVNENRTGGPEQPTRRSYQVGIGVDWEPDLFGRIGLGVSSARAGEQIAQADVAAVELAMRGELAVNYFGLREAEVLIGLLRETIAGYERTLQITRNRYEAGVVARTDVLQAESQLANARADLLALERNRAVLEHAIAVLVGEAPANFDLAPQPKWTARVPQIPEQLPSTLLLRRPDIASAERRVAQANAQIGIARAGYYPSLNLSASLSSSAASIADLFSVSGLAWALGSSLAQTIFDAGATGARVDQARAALEQSAANYRQAVLDAFRDVEDQLVALRVLREQQQLLQQASRAADLVEQQILNRYQAGQINYTEVITAQVAASNARRALVQSQIDRQITAVALIQALGGGWRGLPPKQSGSEQSGSDPH